MPDYVQTDWNVIWTQPAGPNTAMAAIPCGVIDSVTESFGTIEPVYCRNSQTGNDDVVARPQSAPDPITFDLEEYMGLKASDIERAFRRNCPVPLYVGSYLCKPSMTFAGFGRMKVLEDCLRESTAENTLTQREGSAPAMETTSMNARAIEIAFTLGQYRKVTTEPDILRDIAKCGDPACYGACGPNADICETLVIVADADGIGGTAMVSYSTDGGETWTATAVDPFAADINIASVVCFQLTDTTWRWVVAQGSTAAGAPGQVAYSDNIGASWTLADLGAVNGNFVLHGSAMFSTDIYHTWVVDDQGGVWFSDDGCASFTEQITTNALALHGIYFMNANEGAFVGGSGAANVLGTTLDGGTNWTLTAAIGEAVTYTPWAVTMHDRNVLFIVGQDTAGNGEVWYTNDAGANWTQRVLPMPAGMTSMPNLFDIERQDRYCMFIVGEAQVGGVAYGAMWRTVNGGTDWEFWLSEALDATGAGFQALTTCHWNQAFTVGDLETTAVIYEVTD